MTTPDTPELDKLKKINDSGDNDTIAEFLEWAGDNGYHLTKTVMMTDEREHLWREGTYEVTVPVEVPVGIATILAEYFKIDLDKVSAEKDALYAALVAQTQEGND